MSDKPPTYPEESTKQHAIIVEALWNETDRGLVIVAASVLEDHLERLIRHHLRKEKNLIEPMFNVFGPLATFSSKIRVAYAFRFIAPEPYRILERLRKLRNKLAHDKLDDYDEAENKSLVQAFLKSCGFGSVPLDPWLEKRANAARMSFLLAIFDGYLRRCAKTGGESPW